MNNPVLIASDIGCSSFEVKRTSKGVYSWAIKIYNADIKTAYDQAKIIDKRATEDYSIHEETA
jgi:hypothetical protein